MKKNCTLFSILCIMIIILSGCVSIVDKSSENTSNKNNVAKTSNQTKQEKTIENIIEEKIEEIGYDKSKIKRIMKDADWARGPRYKVLYENDFLYVYAFDNNEIASIRDSKLNFLYQDENATGVDEEQVEENTITLIYGQMGDYGKEDIYDSEKYIRYYLPAGKYKVKALTKYAQFFIEKKKISKNPEGYDESDTVRNVEMGDVGSDETIVIKDDECISLTVKSSISLKKSE